MKYCANCGEGFDYAMQGCNYTQAVSRERCKYKNGPMMLRVAYFCCPECLGVYLSVNGNTEHIHHTRIVEV
jgi:hypothetical protein